MPQSSVAAGLHREVLELPLRSLVALKHPQPRDIRGRKYKELRASLKDNGLIEPLAVLPQAKDRYLVVNGNLRLHVLKGLRVSSVRCTATLEKESYTYSRRVTALSPIVEHLIILEAMTNGVTENRLANELRVEVRAIRARIRLLDGICAEAVKLLRDTKISSLALNYLRKMKALEQIRAAELMISGNDVSGAFAFALLHAPSHYDVIKPGKRRGEPDVLPRSTLLEDAVENLGRDLASARKSYGADVLTLSVICRWMEILIPNPEVAKYLKSNHSGVLTQLKLIDAQMNAERAATTNSVL